MCTPWPTKSFHGKGVAAWMRVYSAGKRQENSKQILRTWVYESCYFLALLGNITARQFRVNSAKILNGFVWTKCPVKFFNQLKILPVSYERNLKGEANITSWPLLHLIVIFLRNLPKKLFDLFHWKWLGFKKMLNTMEQFWYVQIHTWCTTMNNTFLLFYSPKVWLLIYWNWSLFASFTVNLPSVEMQAN